MKTDSSALFKKQQVFFENGHKLIKITLGLDGIGLFGLAVSV